MLSAQTVNHGAKNMRSAFDLPQLLQNPRWLKQSTPFPFIYSQNVFTPMFYDALAGHFNEILSRGFAANDRNKFDEGTSWYHVRTFAVTPEFDGPLAIFTSREWHDMIANLFGINATGDINVELHHHPRGNASGWLHNDLNPGWFVSSPKDDGINVRDSNICNYRNGSSPIGSNPRETMRAVALLFYLANPPWSQNDGGATGLYSYAGDPVDRPATMIPPLNNSLVAFECTPYSYHSFIHNRSHPRNSLIMWLHRPKEEVLDRWGERSICYWE